MKPSASSVAALTLVCVLLGACGPATPTSAPGFVPPVVANVPSLVPHIAGLGSVVSIYGWPQVAPPGTSRTFRVWVYSASDPPAAGPSGISSVNVSYNGSLVGSVSLDPSQPSSVATLDWTPPSPPGDYTLHASVPGRSSGNQDDSLDAVVCVQNLGITIQDLEPGDGSDACSPPPAPAASSAAFSITSASASVARIDCTNAQIVFNLTVDDPASQIAYAYVELANVMAPEGHANEVIGSPGHYATYTFTDTVPVGTLEAELGSSSQITWIARVVSYAGQQHSDGPHELTVNFPVCLNVSLPILPLLPRLPDPFHGRELSQVLSAPASQGLGTTATPTALTCRKGSYYDPLSHVCNAKPTETPQPGQKPPACKSYSNASACTSNGCSWDKITNSCG